MAEGLAQTQNAYDERLTVPIRWWVQATMFVATIWIAFIVATPPWVAWGTTAVCLLLTILTFVNIGSAHVAVDNHTLTAGPARIDLAFLADVDVLDAEQTRLTAGRDADARAFMLLRPYLKQSVRITVNDPRDPTPYWLVASRRPGELAAVLSNQPGAPRQPSDALG